MNLTLQHLQARVQELEMELQKIKEEKRKEEENPPCTPYKKKKRVKEETTDHYNAHARGKKTFEIPTIEEVQEYLNQKGITTFTAERFVNYYNSVGWMATPQRPIRDWKAMVKNWKSYDQKRILRMRPDSARGARPSPLPRLRESTEAMLQQMSEHEQECVSYEEYQRMKKEEKI